MSKATVIVLKNSFPDVRKSVTGDGLTKAVQAGGHVIEGYAQINANRVFSSKATNTLANSIHVELVEASEKSAAVHVGPSVIYGRIQEMGGVIKPVHAKTLSWIGSEGVRIFANLVHIPARPYLRPAVDEHKPDIENAVGNALMKSINEAVK